MTTYQAETIWIQKKLFTSYGNAWRWVYSIENIMMQSACAIDLVAQKIRSLDASTKSLEEISNILKKDFIHLGLNKKSAKELQTGLDGYIKAISFTVYFHCSSYHKLLNLVNRVKQTKLDKHVVCNGLANIRAFPIETDLQDFTIRNVARRSFGKSSLSSRWCHRPNLV